MGDSLVPASTLIGFSGMPGIGTGGGDGRGGGMVGVQGRSVEFVHCDSSGSVLVIVVISL